MLWDNTLQELFFKGGFAMYPLLACSIVALALVLERVAVVCWLGADFDAFAGRLGEYVRRRPTEARPWLQKSRKALASVALVYLEHVEAPADLREKAVTLEASRQVSRLERRMSWLSMIASVSTLLGLLGTVTGLVSAFHQIEVKSGQIQPGDLAAGIWEALITTVFGLVIAIPAMAAFHILDGRVAAITLQMEWLVLQLDQWLHPEALHKVPHRQPAKSEAAVGLVAH